MIGSPVDNRQSSLQVSMKYSALLVTVVYVEECSEDSCALKADCGAENVFGEC